MNLVGKENFSFRSALSIHGRNILPLTFDVYRSTSNSAADSRSKSFAEDTVVLVALTLSKALEVDFSDRVEDVEDARCLPSVDRMFSSRPPRVVTCSFFTATNFFIIQREI